MRAITTGRQADWRTATVATTMTNRSGRPLSTEVDAALTSAARELLLERGYDRMSVEAVAKRAGTTRPAFYRRFTSLADVVIHVLLAHFETKLDQTIDTGDLREDLRTAQREQLTLFSDPVVRKCMPGLLAAASADEEVRTTFLEKFILPRRNAYATILQRACDRGEIDPGYDDDWICDLATGPFIMRVQVPGSGPLNEQLAEATTLATLSALGIPPTHDETRPHQISKEPEKST